MALFVALDTLRAELDALRPLAPEQEQRVLQKFRLEWNYNSNAIEGNALTLGETRSLLLHGLTAAGKPLRDHLDIKGHNAAVLGLEDIVRDQRPLTEHFIREMHEVLLGDPYDVPARTPDGQPTRKRIVPGQYKTSPNNVLTATGEMFYFASPEETPALMTDLVDWYRQEDAMPTMHPVALAAEFHYRFVRIHPFDDGNGRMSRLLMNLVLLRRGYPTTVIQATDRNRYLAALAAADAGEPAPFLGFVIENVEASLRLMVRAAKGEAIDEPSDLDKKLALLQVELAGEANAPDTIWTQQTQEHIYEHLIGPWLDELEEQVCKLDFAFVRRQYRVLATNAAKFVKMPDQQELSAKELKHILRTIFTHQPNATPTSITFFAHWEAFRQTGNAFDMTLEITLVFQGSSFRMHCLINDKPRESFYQDTLYQAVLLLTAPYRATYPPELLTAPTQRIQELLTEFILRRKTEFEERKG